MSSILDSYLDELKPSKAVFTLTVNAYNPKRIDCLIKEQVVMLNENNDALRQLVIACRGEYFDNTSHKYILHINDIKRSVIDSVTYFCVLVTRNNPDYKNPKQSKLYRFYNNIDLGNKPEFLERVLMLYKYAAKHFTNDGLIKNGNEAHLKNTLGILELLRKKHE